MEDKTAGEKVISTQKSLSSSHDPGWNDPPKWAFKPDQTGGVTQTKRLLNKRVAFPLSSAPSSPSSTIDQANSRPPVGPSSLTSAPHLPPPPPTGRTHSPPSEFEIDKEQALKETLDNLEAVITKQLDSSSKTDQVRTRLDTMKTMWNEDKLTNSIYYKVLGISKALKNNDAEGADKIHISLMMDDAAACSAWISGIRHIILKMREKTNQTSRLADGEQGSDP